jgi:hypothetical protein
MINKEEIMKLHAGPETDLLVAEQVMGWELETDKAKLRKLSHYFARDDRRRWWRNPEGGWHCDPPAYSSDIKEGWKVVERMRANGKALSLLQSFDGNSVSFDKPGIGEPDYIVERNLLLAICKAALLTVI